MVEMLGGRQVADDRFSEGDEQSSFALGNLYKLSKS